MEIASLDLHFRMASLAKGEHEAAGSRLWRGWWQFRQEWLWGLREGDRPRTLMERDSSGFRRIVEKQKVSRMTLWILAQGLS